MRRDEDGLGPLLGIGPVPWSALALLAALLLALPALAQAALPALTGRVVDGANVIAAERRGSIEAKLRAFEEKTGDQVVVATVPTLGGEVVEDYANRLFRRWHLGTRAGNNGVLLLVAPNDRKVRIEVGYGLEGALTDALTGVIIRTALAPRFKAGDFGGGIEAGVDAILTILAGDAEEWQRRAKIRSDELAAGDLVPLLIFLVIFVLVVAAVMRRASGARRQHRGRRGGWIVAPPAGGGWGGSWGGGLGGGGGFGGFSGGGGSSGGGGASGSW